MAKFVELPAYAGSMISVNVDLIQWVTPQTDTTSYIYFSKENGVPINEPYESVMAKLKFA